MSDSAERDLQAARLRQARAAAGFARPAEAILRFRWKQSTYLAHENGQNGLRPGPAIAYGKAYGVDPGWLLTGSGRGPSGPIRDGSAEGDEKGTDTVHGSVTTPVMDISSMSRDVPVYSGAIAGVDDLVAFEFNGQVIDRVRRPPRLLGVRDAYALYVLGESMSPWREHGGLVYVHPHLPVNPNDYVVVQLKQEADGGPIPAYIKRLVRRSASEIRLRQYNPAKELVIPMKKVWKIEKVLDWGELLA